jgi:hypothetical protein
MYLERINPSQRASVENNENPMTRFHMAAYGISKKMLDLRNEISFADYANTVNPNALP